MLAPDRAVLYFLTALTPVAVSASSGRFVALLGEGVICIARVPLMRRLAGLDPAAWYLPTCTGATAYAICGKVSASATTLARRGTSSGSPYPLGPSGTVDHAWFPAVSFAEAFPGDAICMQASHAVSMAPAKRGSAAMTVARETLQSRSPAAPASPKDVITIDDDALDSQVENEGSSKLGKRKGEVMSTNDTRAIKIQRSNLLSRGERGTAASATDGPSAVRSSVLKLGLVTANDPIPVSFLTWNVNGLAPRVRASQWLQFAEYVKETSPVSYRMPAPTVFRAQPARSSYFLYGSAYC